MKRSVFTILAALLFSASLLAQLSGPKSIPGNYPTVEAAIAELNAQGVGSGGVTFNIAAGYTETFTSPVAGLITATGASDKPVLFQKSGIGNNPVITAGTGTSTTLDGIIVIAGGDYFTFDGIDLNEKASNADQTTRMEFGYELVKASSTAPVNGCQNITIKNCNITLNVVLTATTFTTATGIYASNHTATSAVNISTIASATDISANCKFYNNNISNVTNGIRVWGWNSASAPYDLYDQNYEIGVEGANTITNFTDMAINPRYQKGLKVANNIMSNTTSKPTGNIYGVYVQNAANCDAYNNTVTMQLTSGNMSINGLNVHAGETGFTGSIYGNVVQNCTNITATSGAFNGISNAGNPTTLYMHSNKVINNTYPGTGSFTGITSGSVPNLVMYNNEISNNIKTGTSGSFTGIAVSGQNSSVYNNKIFTNYNNTTATSNQSAAFVGMSVQNGNPANVYNNLLYDLSNGGGGVNFSMAGINIQSGTLTNVYNNYVYDLRGPLANPNINPAVDPRKNLIAGINNTTSPAAINLYFNTVFLMAESTGLNFSTAAVNAGNGPKIDMRNNILVNLSTPQGDGVTVAFRRTSTDLSNYLLTSNANCLFGGIAEDEYYVTYFDGTNTYDFASYLALLGPVRESGSFRELPPFTSIVAPIDLHLLDFVPTLCESGGVQITSPAITTDYDGNTRSAAPDLGADEFGGIPIGVVNPGAVSATPVSSHQINLGFAPNGSNNDVVIVWNNTGAFTTPSGTPPAVGNAFAGGTVLYTGITSPASHTNLVGATSYYYKAFSFNGTDYSTGVGVFASTNIAPPSAFTATAVSPTQIDLTWTKNLFNNDVIVAYKKNDATAFGTPVSGTTYNVNDVLPGGGIIAYSGPASGFNHVGLDPNITTYYYQAWSVDPTNNTIYSPTAVNASAATLCSSATIPFFESFEYNGALGCGTVYDGFANSNTWFPAYSFPKTGQVSLRINGGFGALHDDWYFTNGLELEAGVTYQVKFWYRTQNLGNPPHQIEVKWGNSPTPAGMTSAPIFYNATMTQTTTYTQVTCTSFTPATTGIYHVGWHDFTSGVAASHYLVMDDITINALIPPASPTNLTATANLSSIYLNYNLNPAGNQVIIATNSSPAFDQPVNGTTYAIGSTIGNNGTVIYQGLLNEFTHTGLSPNTTYYYKAWSVDNIKMYSVNGATANATTVNFHHICVPTGWGGLSSYMVPEVPALETVLSEINDNMQIMISNSGLYWPSQNINTIGNWNTYEGYKIKMNQQACFHVVGEMVENTAFTIHAGTSIIPVLCDQSVDAMDFFSQFGTDIVFAYDFYTQSMYWPIGGIYSLDYLEPGVGYLVKMSAQRQATYSCGKANLSNYVKAEPVMFENAPWSFAKSGIQHFIAIENIALAGLEKGDFVGVFNAQGECAGMTQFNGQLGNLMLVAYGDDITTGATKGLAEGQDLSFRIYSASRMTEIPVQVSYSSAAPNAGSFAEMGQSVIYKMTEGATAVSENLMDNINIHPNPGTGIFNLEIPSVDQMLNLKVENSAGQVVYSEIINANVSGLNHELNLSDVKPGMYFVRVTGKNQTIVKKLIVR